MCANIYKLSSILSIKYTDIYWYLYFTLWVCVSLYNFVGDLINLKIIIKEVINNLVVNSENLKFVSRSTVYE